MVSSHLRNATIKMMKSIIVNKNNNEGDRMNNKKKDKGNRKDKNKGNKGNKKDKNKGNTKDKNKNHIKNKKTQINHKFGIRYFLKISL